MPASIVHPSTFPSPIAVGLRVANVRRAAEFYEAIGFTFVMAVPDEDDEWLLCLLRYGSGSILLGPLDHLRFPRRHVLNRLHGAPRGTSIRVDLTVPDLAVAYAACLAAGCVITVEPAEELWGDRTFSCIDPFGYEWRFTQAAARRMLKQITNSARAVWS